MKQSISIQLKMSEIIYDIQNKTYLTGRSISSGSNPGHVANMQANDDDENSAQILRSVTMAAAILRNRLAEYLDSSDVNVSNDSLTAADNLGFSLNMPSNFNANVTKVLSDAIHQFIVSTAIADWFAITAKGETADYTETARSSLDVIVEALCKRRRPIRQEV